MDSDEEIGNLEREEVAIIVEIAEVLERRQKDKLPALDVQWLKDLQREVNVTKQDKVDITKENLKKSLGRMPNWKSPGPDLVQGFW